MAGRQALGRLVDQQQRARFDDRARDRHHLLLAAGQCCRPGSCQNLRSAGKKPQIQSTRAASSGPSRAASTRFSRTVSAEKTAMFSGT